MRLLLIDTTYPGAFRHLGAAQSLDGSVFLSEHRHRESALDGVRHIQVRVPRPSLRTSRTENLMVQTLQRAEAFADAMHKLKAQGFAPDAICLDGSSGCGFYAADVFYGVPLLGVFDWFHGSANRHTETTAGAPPDVEPSESASTRSIRNLFQLHSLQACDRLVTGSSWQRESYPEPWRSRLHIIPEGVDTALFSPGASSVRVGNETEPCELVTYIARTLAPDGGCGLLCSALPEVLARRPHCHVLMVGHPKGQDENAARMALLAGLDVDRQRVHFKKFCSYDEYRAILRASSAHVFLSPGPVLASGLLEAMSCGCLLVASDGGPVREVLRHGRNALLTPYGDVPMLTNQLLTALEAGPAMKTLREAAREEAVRRFDSHLSASHYANLLHALVKDVQ